MSSGETTAKCPGLWMWPLSSIWPQGPENRSWPSFYLVVQKQSEVQRNTPKCDRCFSHKLKMKGRNRTKAAPARRPAWVSGSRWAEHLANWSLLPLKKFFGWLAQVELNGKGPGICPTPWEEDWGRGSPWLFTGQTSSTLKLCDWSTLSCFHHLYMNGATDTATTPGAVAKHSIAVIMLTIVLNITHSPPDFCWVCTGFFMLFPIYIKSTKYHLRKTLLIWYI